jgi:hypothetical protein
MLPHPSGTTKATTIGKTASQEPPEDDGADAATEASSTRTDDASAKLPEPHWDSVIGAATD